MDRVLLITGASSGIGAATARAAAAKGWKLGLMARSTASLEALVAEIGADRALALSADVSSAEAQRTAFDTLAGRFGRLDAVFANAGLGATTPGAETGDLENWREMVEVNIWGCW